MPERSLVLVKHALPELRADVAPRDWQLGPNGHAGAQRLVNALRELCPFRLESSPEPKAVQTGELVAAELGIPRHVRVGLEEIDRPAQPIVSREAHTALNARLFSELTHAVVGNESAEHALSRFEVAIAAAMAVTPPDEHLVVVTHGTVIALFAAAHNGVDAFALWQRLSCPSFVRLAMPSYALLDVRESL